MRELKKEAKGLKKLRRQLSAFVFQILLIFQLRLQNQNLLFQFGYF